MSVRLSQLAGDRFTYGQSQSLSAQDKPDPIQAVRLLEWVRGWDSRLSHWMGQDDLVGRREELTCLEEQIERTLAGQGQVLTISGEAGMGKSRLAGELLRRWLRRDASAYVGAATAATQYSPYHTWGELLRDFFDLGRTDQDPALVETALQEINPNWLPRLPLLSDVLGLGLPDNDLTRHLDAQLRQQSTQSLLVDLIRHRATQGPLLLVLEDVHWMDHLSWRVALAVAYAIRERPVLLCLVHRPLGDLPPSDYQRLVDLPNHTALPLRELSPDEAVGLAASGVPFISPGLEMATKTVPLATGSVTKLATVGSVAVVTAAGKTLASYAFALDAALIDGLTISRVRAGVLSPTPSRPLWW